MCVPISKKIKLWLLSSACYLYLATLLLSETQEKVHIQARPNIMLGSVRMMDTRMGAWLNQTSTNHCPAAETLPVSSLVMKKKFGNILLQDVEIQHRMAKSIVNIFFIALSMFQTVMWTLLCLDNIFS